ncbi:MAG: FAD-dependent oxidoreductase [Desulfurococcaceae archaeon]
MGNYMNFAFMCREKTKAINAKVAIIGAGPAGLAAAGFLACEGYEVDVYDKQPLPGGLMMFAIPPWRIPPERVIGGIERLREVFGVKFITKTKVYYGESAHEEGDTLAEKHVNFEDVLSSYDLVLVATGTWNSKVPKIPGVSSKGVTTALEYLYEWRIYELGYLDRKPLSGKRVVVVGAGYSAIDAAEKALKEGSEVFIVYRRTIKEAPAGVYEVEKIKREGAIFMELVSPLEIIAENNHARGVKLQRMKLGPPDETGRPRPEPIPGSEFTLEADLVVLATGETPTPPVNLANAEKIGLRVNKDGTLQVNQIMQTSIPKVFAAGDVVHGPSRIGPALKSGLKASKYMHNWLSAKAGKTPSLTLVR